MRKTSQRNRSVAQHLLYELYSASIITDTWCTCSSKCQVKRKLWNWITSPETIFLFNPSFHLYTVQASSPILGAPAVAGQGHLTYGFWSQYCKSKNTTNKYCKSKNTTKKTKRISLPLNLEPTRMCVRLKELWKCVRHETIFLFNPSFRSFYICVGLPWVEWRQTLWSLRLLCRRFAPSCSHWKRKSLCPKEIKYTALEEN